MADVGRVKAATHPNLQHGQLNPLLRQPQVADGRHLLKEGRDGRQPPSPMEPLTGLTDHGREAGKLLGGDRFPIHLNPLGDRDQMGRDEEPRSYSRRP